MSSCIDSIWLYENVREQAPQFAQTLKDLILVAPSIEIIRCRECKHFWKYSDLPTKCVFHLSLVNADDFCSYGERKESE